MTAATTTTAAIVPCASGDLFSWFWRRWIQFRACRSVRKRLDSKKIKTWNMATSCHCCLFLVNHGNNHDFINDSDNDKSSSSSTSSSSSLLVVVVVVVVGGGDGGIAGVGVLGIGIVLHCRLCGCTSRTSKATNSTHPRHKPGRSPWAEAQGLSHWKLTKITKLSQWQ